MGTQLPSQKGELGPHLAQCGLDQGGTWYGGRPQPRRRCVRWGPSPLPKRGGATQISAVYCGQTAAWMKTPLGTEVDLGPGYTLLDPAPREKGTAAPFFGPCLLWPRSPISGTAERLLCFVYPAHVKRFLCLSIARTVDGRYFTCKNRSLESASCYFCLR